MSDRFTKPSKKRKASKAKRPRKAASGSSVVGYNDAGEPVRRAPLGRVQSEDAQ